MNKSSPNESWQPTPGLRLGCFRLFSVALGPARLHPALGKQPHERRIKMKITTFSLIMLTLLSACSRQDPAVAQPHQVNLSPGDLAAPAEITTNASGSSLTYSLQVKLSAAREAELVKFARTHPNGNVRVMLGGRVLTDLRMPGGEAGKISTIGVAAVFDSPSEAQTVAESLNQLVK